MEDECSRKQEKEDRRKKKGVRTGVRRQKGGSGRVSIASVASPADENNIIDSRVMRF
jgi:hypothetical protein